MAIPTTRFLLICAAAAALTACQKQGDADQTAADADSIAAVNEAAPLDETGNAAMPTDRTITENLAASGDHSSLMNAIKAAGLETTFAGPGPYTLFAPTNAAFEKLPAGTAETLMKPEEKSRLTSILTYHVVPGVVTAADLAKAAEGAGGTAELATLGGGNLKISTSSGGVVITDAKGNSARVSQADMVQANGVVHSIDAVLMPS